MEQTRLIASITLLFVVASPVLGDGDASTLPLIEGRTALATVNGEPITVDEFFRDLATLHEAAEDGGGARSHEKPGELLERMINARLVVQEAANIGLDELPQFQSALASYTTQLLKQTVYRRYAESNVALEFEDYETEYRDATREVKVRSVLIPSEETARGLSVSVVGGGDFESLTRELVEDGRAEIGDDQTFLPSSQLLPAVKQAISVLKFGEVTAPIKIGEKFALVQVLDERFVEDPQLKRQIGQDALTRKRAAALQAYAESLVEQHAGIDEKLLDSLDYHAAEPGFDALLDDSRELVRIEGAKSVRVADLSLAIQQEFFHGIDNAIESGKINLRKRPLLSRILIPRVVLLEARRQKIETSDEYAARLREFEDGLLFSMFVERVLQPEIRVSRDEVEAYRLEHLDEFSTPELMRVDRIAFRTREDAESALAKLRAGTDFRWALENADGLLDPRDAADVLSFPAGLVVTDLFPAPVRAALSGATTGEYRLHAAADGSAYVLRVLDVVAPVPRALDEVGEEISGRVFSRKREVEIDDWIAKLRAASEIAVFADPEALDRLLVGMIASGS